MSRYVSKNILSTIHPLNFLRIFFSFIYKAPILTFFKYIVKLKYDEKPDYDKYRKDFVNGLKVLGKSNSGDLEFALKTSSTPKRATAAASGASSKAQKIERENGENVSPKVKISRKRNISKEPNERDGSPSKISRSDNGAKSSIRQRATATSSKLPSVDSSIVVNNHVNDKSGTKTKTYNLNFELDISFDANVVVNVKRKSKKSPKTADKKKLVNSDANDSVQSTDEIPASENSFVVQTTKVIKKGTRFSPRAK